MANATSHHHDSGNTYWRCVTAQVQNLEHNVRCCLPEGSYFDEVWDVNECLQTDCKSIQMEDVLQHMQLAISNRW